METNKISAIFRDERTLEKAISHLTEKTLSLGEVSVQGPPSEMLQKFGKSYISPETLQKAEEFSPKTEPYMHDDFGWKQGFSISIPMFIGIILGLLAGGELRYYYDNVILGAIGGLIGAVIGFFIMKSIRQSRISKIEKQERMGGFVLWLVCTNEQQQQAIFSILKEHHAENITLHRENPQAVS
ncbi:hypothetical protein Lbir_0350 [Legionella birminghamensis]|uniref:Transmembrane protein n=1 Tax=Legionella birminghamensis TaxID=28083 RepID=A0A378IA84_9GAMM|nr:hypothetical protein [Legionella birminghamensis]KTC75630.1 hypothetical protein Lbir_0350 [Legionella birminghamensis]STX31953.1 Uncharacterised protein [Legionella birminghamensis]